MIGPYSAAQMCDAGVDVVAAVRVCDETPGGLLAACRALEARCWPEPALLLASLHLLKQIDVQLGGKGPLSLEWGAYGRRGWPAAVDVAGMAHAVDDGAQADHDAAMRLAAASDTAMFGLVLTACRMLRMTIEHLPDPAGVLDRLRLGLIAQAMRDA